MRHQRIETQSPVLFSPYKVSPSEKCPGLLFFLSIFFSHAAHSQGPQFPETPVSNKTPLNGETGLWTTNKSIWWMQVYHYIQPTNMKPWIGQIAMRLHENRNWNQTLTRYDYNKTRPYDDRTWNELQSNMAEKSKMWFCLCLYLYVLWWKIEKMMEDRRKRDSMRKRGKGKTAHLSPEGCK